MRSILLVIAVTLWLPCVLLAQEWQPVGSSSFEAITGLSDGSLLVIQYPGDILRSTDLGVTWSYVHRGGALEGRLVGFGRPSPGLSPEGARNEMVLAYCDSGTALVSSDSGRTWARTENGEWRTGNEIAPHPLPFTLYPLLSARIVLGDSSNVLLSRDSGMSWEKVLSASEGCAIHCIATIDSVCYAVGEPGLIYASDTSFQKWTELHHAPFGDIRPVGLETIQARLEQSPAAMRPSCGSIDFSSGSHGAIAVGNKIYITEDSGTSWKQSIVPDTNSISSVWISDTSLLAGMSDGMLFFASNSCEGFRECDSILYYAVQRSVEPEPIHRRPIISIRWKDKSEGDMFVLTDSMLYDMKSDLSSASPYQFPLRPGELAESACFPDQYTGFILTDSAARLDTFTIDGLDTTVIHDTGFVYRTLDGGATWNLVLKNIPGLKKMFFVNTHRGFVCGENGLIMRTDDSGSTWSRTFTATRQNLRDIRMANDTVGYAAGDSGVVLFTRYAGRWWQLSPPEPLFAHPSAGYNSIALSDNNTAYVLGADRCYKESIPNPPPRFRFNHNWMQRQTLSVSVSPNPAQGDLDIEISSSASEIDGLPSLSIDDVSGRPVIENIQCFESGSGQWSAKTNLASAAPGVYAVVATMGGQTARCNFVIER